MQPVVTWARARGLKVHLSEFGANAVTRVLPRRSPMPSYLDANADVVIGWAWWAYGPPAWWAGYRFTLCPTNDYTVDDPKLAARPTLRRASLPTIRPASVTRRAPSDSTFTSTKTVEAGDFVDVPAGTYSLKVSTRTTFSDNETFCVTMTLENASDVIDVDWKELTVDLRGHTLESAGTARTRNDRHRDHDADGRRLDGPRAQPELDWSLPAPQYAEQNKVMRSGDHQKPDVVRSSRARVVVHAGRTGGLAPQPRESSPRQTWYGSSALPP